MTYDAILFAGRPGLVYQYAYDWLAVRLCGISDGVAHFESGDFQTTELIRRIRDINKLNEVSESETLSGIVWLEPLLVDSKAHLAQIEQQLRSGGKVFVIVGGRLSRFLQERKQSAMTGYAGEQAIQTILKQSGFVVEDRIGFHSTRAIVWHQLSVIANRLGYEHLRDRCHYAMRRDFVTRRGMAALVCLVARKGS